jgi:Aminotransferase class I and II
VLNDRPKVIAFESVYSRGGYDAPMAAICDLADKYSAMTYLDEVHAAGLNGILGFWISEQDVWRIHSYRRYTRKWICARLNVICPLARPETYARQMRGRCQ